MSLLQVNDITAGYQTGIDILNDLSLRSNRNLLRLSLGRMAQVNQLC